jgi:hypothetical protein
MTAACSMSATRHRRPPQRGQAKASRPNVRRIRSAHARLRAESRPAAGDARGPHAARSGSIAPPSAPVTVLCVTTADRQAARDASTPWYSGRLIRGRGAFVEEIAPARTFGFLKEVEMLRQRGLALGGSLDNAIVLGETGVLNHALRFEDEFVRHKILDAIGDLSLVGYPVIGHLVADRAGHALHTAFAARILEQVDAWKIVDGEETAAGAALSNVAVTPAARLAN